MAKEEDKDKIISLLIPLLWETRAGGTIDDIRLSEDEETVSIYFLNGSIRDVNVACDSGIALIKDILRALE